MMNDGEGVAWKGDAQGWQINEDGRLEFDLETLLSELGDEESAETEIVELQDKPSSVSQPWEP